ncbi:MAG: site-2 protease family protein, partial [Myxococcota bacterium]
LLQSGISYPMTGWLYLQTLATDPEAWLMALAYAGPVLAILMAHEMGHYLPARRYGVTVTPPYFLPGLPPFGTFGAFIRMQIETMSASKLFRIGAGGPYAGFVVALPTLVIGLMLSDVKPLPEGLEGAHLGDSLLMWGLTALLFPDIPEGHDLFLHPMAFAGWVGMFVTAFNLVPLGQLDGGHVAYTLFGERFNAVVLGLLVVMIGLGVAVFPGWLVLVAFVLLMGPEHPPVLDEEDRLEGLERWFGYGALVMFVLTFIPQPFEVPTILDMFMD